MVFFEKIIYIVEILESIIILNLQKLLNIFYFLIHLNLGLHG